MRARALVGRIGVSWAVTAAALAVAPAGVAGSAPADGDVIPGAYIVTLVPGSSPDAVAKDHGRRLGAEVAHVYRHAARGYAARMSAGAAARVAADPQVRTVVADRVVRISAKGGGGAPANEKPTGVARVGGGVRAGAPVAVLDTGIDLTHQDLNVSHSGVNCSTGSSFADGNGHGTHVAGTIGAKANGRGVLGVAPGTLVHPVRVLNNAGSGSWSSIICGIDWVTARAQAIPVANMSLGGSGAPGACGDGGLRDAICKSVAAGVTYVVAAGNENDDSANHVPASYDEVITVSALADSDGTVGPLTWRASCRADQEDTRADFSNYGAPVDLIAPGVCIASTWKGGGYSTISGTSMASPHVAAAAALFVKAHATATTSPSPAEVKAALLARGGTDWDARDDRDTVKEPLLHVDTL